MKKLQRHSMQDHSSQVRLGEGNLYETNQAQSVELVKLWIMRLLIKGEIYKRAITSNGFAIKGLVAALGLAEELGGHFEEFDDESEDFNPEHAKKVLFRFYRALERRSAKISEPEILRTNIETLQETIGFGHVEAKILAMMVLMNIDQAFNAVCEFIEVQHEPEIYKTIAIALNLSVDAVRTELNSPKSLETNGILQLRQQGCITLAHHFDAIQHSVARELYFNYSNPLLLLGNRILPSQDAELRTQDFTHLAQSLNTLKHYLKYALRTRQQGVNILLYGPPGTGKTQLSRLLAEQLSPKAYEISFADADNDAIPGRERLAYYKFAQKIFEEQPVIFIFDEIEDVFDSDTMMSKMRGYDFRKKAWFNQLFETNANPTFWISNSIESLDPAYIRRFDIVLELNVPSAQQRKNIVRKQCTGLISPKLISHIAEVDNLAPAIVARAAKVVSSFKSKLDLKARDEVYQSLVNSTLTAMQLAPIPAMKSAKKINPLSNLYNPEWIQADADLANIMKGLRKSRSGRLCLYGPPGTGKSAYARWLADELSMPLISKRVSDLVDKFLGETEKQIAAAFQQASEKGAILVFDEVDSFLQDRRRATHQWESSQVNEMLTQLESFEGIFIGSTNLMGQLDQAVLRRFDLSVKFDFLLPAQVESLFLAYCKQLNLGKASKSELARIRQLQQLTPGDFGTVSNQSKFKPIESIADLINALAQTCALKESKKQPIGFLASGG